MKIIAVSNHKGGVGKTTTSVNLGAFLAKDHGKKVLIVDLDQQGHATDGFGIDSTDSYTVADLICADSNNPISFEEVKKQTYIKGLDLLPADLNLSLAEMKLYTMLGREFRLRNILSKLDYDYVIIDCPPAFTMLTINAFVAATEIILPIQLVYYGMKGVDGFLKGIQFINSQIASLASHKVEIKHVLITFFDLRKKMAKQIYKSINEVFGDLVFDTKIPVNTKLDEAQAHQKPIFDYDENCTGFQSYRELANELIRRHS